MFSLFFSSKFIDLFSMILSTELQPNLCLGKISLMLRKSLLLGMLIFPINFLLFTPLEFQVTQFQMKWVFNVILLRISQFSMRSPALILYLGSTFKQSLMKFYKSLEYWIGILLYTPLMIVFLSDFKSWLTKGGRKAAIQYSTQPKDQISHLAL